jgi:hypothetical protein
VIVEIFEIVSSESIPEEGDPVEERNQSISSPPPTVPLKKKNKLVPLYTDLFLYNSVCHQRLSLRFFLLDKMWFTNIKAALATCKDIFPTRSSELVD